MGLLGKASAILMGTGVPVVSTGFAYLDVQSKTAQKQIPIGGKLALGVLSWVNNMANSFGLDQPFRGGVSLKNEAGTVVVISPSVESAGTSKGWGWSILATGGIGLLADRVGGWVAGRRGGVKAAGFQALGGK